jgi:hypothetical protein
MCVLFDYAQVAWVFDPCTEDNEDFSDDVGETHHYGDPLGEGTPRLHCVPDSSIFGPTTLEASTHIIVVTDEIPLYSSSVFSLADEAYEKNTLWRDVLFKRTVTHPYHHRDLTYRLFLSILQI